MFLVKYFKNSLYSIKGIYSLKDENIIKVLLYFILVATISLLPHNLEIVREKGFKLGFISEAYNDEARFDLYDSKVVKVGTAGIRVDDDFVLEVYEFDTFTLVIDYNDEFESVENTTLVLKRTSTEYYDSNGSMMVGNYNSFTEDIHFSSLRFDETLYTTLFTGLEKAFYPFITLFSILVNVSTNFAMYIIMIALMAVILGFLKYRFSHFLSYKEICKILVFSMTLPSVIVFIIGLFGGFAFTPVIMNFMMGGIAVLTLLKVGKNKLELPTK